ncbi:YmL49-like protein [Ophiocordyceps sinensis CO18]|uniref:Large ribosomal subunit protein bL21m n=1 Tax=Ophiocordyceps sinensis (strain Co18 / CGMCC 3.14243) TaxID=911162 RepID=T5A6D6_OPHSC|nr:YmL49-like protein [Ophiocordyceps sinensis CO18]
MAASKTDILGGGGGGAGLRGVLCARVARGASGFLSGSAALATPTSTLRGRQGTQEGDRVRLPFRIPGVLPGDVLRLDRASVIGSRDYTMKGAPHIDPALFQCRATVLGVESEPLRIKIKTKRRQRKQKRVKSKHRYTILRISELVINAGKKGPAARQHIESAAKAKTAPQIPATQGGN